MKIQQNYSDYFLNNPGFTMSGASDCFSVPGVTCRSMNVKLPDTIDTETQLLRGVPSDLFIPQMPAPEPQPTDSYSAQDTFTPTHIIPTEPTRMSKSCYFEQSTYDRIHGILPSDYDNTRHVTPLWASPELIVGTASRMISKYSD